MSLNGHLLLSVLLCAVGPLMARGEEISDMQEIYFILWASRSCFKQQTWGVTPIVCLFNQNFDTFSLSFYLLCTVTSNSALSPVLCCLLCVVELSSTLNLVCRQILLINQHES